MGHNSSNNSLVQANNNNNNNANSKDPNIMRLHKRSKSHAAPNKTRQSLTKSAFDPNVFMVANENETRSYEKKLL